jgi:hypothetical protein
MTIPQAIVASALIVGAAILGSKVIAPYQIVNSRALLLWRLNTITGDVRVCDPYHRAQAVSQAQSERSAHPGTLSDAEVLGTAPDENQQVCK